MSHYKPYHAYKDSGVEWLGQVPEHWAVCKLSFRYSIELGKMLDEKKLTKTNLVSYLRNQDVQWGSINTQDLPEMDIHSGELERYTIRNGDLLVCEGGDVGRAAIWRGENSVFGYQKALHRLRHRSVGADTAEFFYFSLLTAKQRGVFEESDSKATIAHLPAEKFRQYRFAFPPLAEQQTIASHLDRETARIDALVEKKTRFIELLREKRQALITHAVTKGLASKVKMKYSGVEWLGEVPEHWEVKQLKHVVDPNSSITYGIVQAGPEYEGGVPYIRTSDMSGDALPISGYPLTSPEIDGSYARSRVRPGDIVMSIRASVGKCLPVPDGLSVANLTQGTAKVSPGKDITRDFLLTYLNSGAGQVYFDLMAKGATFKEITLDALRRTPVLLPPKDEQAEIDQFIAQHIGRLDQLWQLSERSIGMLKERRSALITAAVTGQIDLRETV